jgi:hypothetical protein
MSQQHQYSRRVYCSQSRSDQQHSQSRPPLTEQYGIFALGTWSNYYSEWSNGRGRWTEGRRMFQGVSLTPEQICEGPITTAPTPITRSNTVQSSEGSSHVPISEMASALFSYFQHSGNDIIINALLGEHMTALVRSIRLHTASAC